MQNLPTPGCAVPTSGKIPRPRVETPALSCCTPQPLAITKLPIKLPPFGRTAFPTLGVTIDDIAELANTSTATVSRALNNKPGVTESTRQRITSLADKLGYRPNRIAQNLALQKSHVVGIVAADLVNAFYIQFFRCVQRTIEPRGYQVLIADSEQSIEKERHNIEVMRQHRAEGLLIFPVGDWKRDAESDHLLELRLRKFPFVLIGKVEGLKCDWVTSDEINTGREIAGHLVSLGHRRIGFVGRDPENRCVRERLQGVREGLAAAQLPLRDEHTVDLRDGWIEDMARLLRQPGRPTALVFINDICALMAHRRIHELGLSIPGDLSIAAFDDGIWTRHLKPTISTTSEDGEEVARIAMDLLLQRMDDPERPPEQHLVPQKFLVRESTGPAPR